MIKFNIKPLVVAIGLSVFSFSAAAELIATKTVLKPTDTAKIDVKFATSVTGDLYLATVLDGKLVFFADKATKLTEKPTPYQTNTTFSGTIHLLDVSALGIPPNFYPLYEVVAKAGSDVLNFTNWVGGLGALNRMNVAIGLPSSVTNDTTGKGFPDDDDDHDGYRNGDHDKNGEIDDCKATTPKKEREEHENDDDHNSSSATSSSSSTGSNVASSSSSSSASNGTSSSSSTASGSNVSCNASATPPPVTPAPAPVAPPVAPTPATPISATPPPAPAGNGAALYKSLGCSASGCHTGNPAANKNKILNGKTLGNITKAIVNNPSDMGFLKTVGDPQFASDADLQAIADYLSTH